MSKLFASAVAGMVLIQMLGSDRKEFAKYKVIEAYEVRPGILMMPRYSADGRICEIGLEKLHYSPEVVRLGSSLSQQEISQIFDELVPSGERGPRLTGFLEQGMETVSGRSSVTDEEYQNVTISVEATYFPVDGKNEAIVDPIVATVRWKDRKCK